MTELKVKFDEEQMGELVARVIEHFAIDNGNITEIVRCKDCKHWKGNDEPIPWNDDNVFVEAPCETKPMDFCSMGERKEDND